MKTILGILAASTLILGCAQDERDGQHGDLTISALTDTAISGTYVFNGDTLVFEATQLQPKEYQISLELHGMTLDAHVDAVNLVWDLDGYTTADGSSTQITEEDSWFVLRFVKDLEAEIGEYPAGLGDDFGRVINMWGEWIPAMDPNQLIVMDLNHGSSSMCTWNGSAGQRVYKGACGENAGGVCNYNWYYYANHDGWTCNNGDSDCQSIAQIGDHYSCDGDAWVWEGTYWSCRDQDHDRRRYVTGICYGRCGEGCGSGRSYTYGCLQHDNCVRNGHWITSSWCSDELTRTSSHENCY